MPNPAPMPDGTPDPIKTIAAIPWYQSTATIAQATGMLSILMVMFPKIAVALGLTKPEDAQLFVVKVFGGIGIAVLAWGFVKRIFSKVQPITLTAKQAAANPNTVAQVAATAAVRSGDPLDKPSKPPKV